MRKKQNDDDQQTIVCMFEQQVVRKPQAVAIICGKQSISYDELNQRADQLAYILAEQGVEKDRPIAICMPRSIDFLVVILGILKAGGACVPLDLANPEERLLRILSDDQIPMLITTNEMDLKLRGYQGRIFVVSNQLETKKPRFKATVLPEQLAYIIYTSGTTGKPKGVLIEHKSIVNYTKWFAEVCSLGAPKDLHHVERRETSPEYGRVLTPESPHYVRDDGVFIDVCPKERGWGVQERIDFSSNHAFDFALTTSIVPLLLGLTVVICEDKIKKDPDLYIDYLQANKISVIKLTPSYFQVLLQQAEMKTSSLDCLEKIILGGERLLAKYCASWLALYPSHILFNEYGPTETTVAVSSKRVDKKNISHLEADVPIGSMIPNCDFYIMNDEGKPVEKGEVGELWVSGICLARGYLNQAALTARKFIKNPYDSDQNSYWYKTGDQCRFLPNSELDYLGRIDEQIKIRGYRIEPAEIEDSLRQHPALESVMVDAVDDHRKEKRLVAYYILHNKKMPIADGDLRQYLKQYLPDYMIPAFFIVMESFPLNANDKLNRKEFPVPDFIQNVDYERPENSSENTIARVWSNEFGYEVIGINENFFELGGHSLSAARIISTLTQVMGKKISMQQFYQNPTIRALANLLDKQEKISRFAKFPKKIYQKNFQLLLSDFQFILWLSKIFEPKANKLNICSRKRFHGYLDEKKIHESLDLILKKHEVLSYRVSSFIPMQQRSKKKLKIQIEINHLESLAINRSELILEQSINDLRSKYLWSKNYALFKIRLFYLERGMTELQLCTPHIISDEQSHEILFDDLSQFYLANALKKSKKDQSYREYLYAENEDINSNKDSNILFWKGYLKEASLFAIPQPYVVSNMKRYKFAYSSYTEIPENSLEDLRIFCSKNHFSFDNGLCGVLLLALTRLAGELNKNSVICINKVKSARDNSRYDSTIGCFLNLELAKVKIDEQQDLASFCQQLSESIIRSNPYQSCSNLIKLASVGSFSKLNRVKDLALNSLVSLYNLIFSPYKINKTVINSGLRLKTVKDNYFLINVNIYSSFLQRDKRNDPLFGYAQEPIPSNKHDLLTIDNFLDICFLRMENHKPYLVVSANLTSEFQELLRQQVLEIFESIRSSDI
ncbi:Linear gramicidin synthase subunit D [Legionella massiliensis]|uniref:Linear gramicidin synthase subunit D n=1 Tax=Legionella massiliensis TaxID=1034943 RepID=A0A078KZF6_9GAMM|nr:amino acid adenylation domain-containing protein [Legionella massiliensis]CDZ77169.1 Linear gramicidin synthase subunit D [Legionella massiliensis]CEE12907.1 Linear gramicidin synthase subunit D [Legionella massiliensis]